MKFNSLSLIIFSLFFIINCLNTFGNKITVEDERSIEMVIDEYFKDEKQSCKNEYRNIERLILENDNENKFIQHYLETVNITSCTRHSVGFQVLSRELYSIYREFPQDKKGKKCNESQIQQDFDKYGVCMNICYVKVANYLYILKNHFQTRLQRNQVELISTCSKVNDKRKKSAASTISRGIYYLPFCIYIICSILF